MKHTRIFLALVVVIMAGPSLLAQKQAKVSKQTQKSLMEAMSSLPADLQEEVLAYARRKAEAYKAVTAAAPAPAPAPAVAVYPPQADPARQQPAAQPSPQPAESAAIQLNGGSQLASPAAPAAPAAPDYMQQAQQMAQTTVEWSGTEFNFGTVPAGAPVTHRFTFKNTGSAPLSLTRVKASCGCTTPSYSKDPVPPGEEGFIDVKFDTNGKSGPQTKTVTVVGNFPNQQVILRIRGELTAPAAAPAPQN
jgi:hypothetical protein